MDCKITHLLIHDVRFKTSNFIGDAMHTDPDYTAGYVILQTDGPHEGHGLTFTLGRGNEVVCLAIKALRFLVVNRTLSSITSDFATFWRSLTCETQLRWLGPEKGAIHLAVSAIINAVWDLWAKAEQKPLWRLLADMEPQQLVSCLDFRYVSDYLTRDEAVQLLSSQRSHRQQREHLMNTEGFPAYSTSVGWLGYSDEKLTALCNEAYDEGFRYFKLKVGSDVADDIRRLKLVNKAVVQTRSSEEKVRIMVDANQRWEIAEAVEYMKKLKEQSGTDLWWIEEPTSPDDVLGHAAIRRQLKEQIGVGVATGEHCANRVIFKQLLQADAVDVVQPDITRLGGINEAVLVCLLAAKKNVPVCFHAGGVGLCELSQHLAFWDYISLTGSLEGRVLEYVSHLHEHFHHPVALNSKGKYVLPHSVGSSLHMKSESIQEHSLKLPFEV